KKKKKKKKKKKPKTLTQPLNLTYPRFWIEVMKDVAYLAIVDKKALNAFDPKNKGKCPLKSCIGAYIDKTMELELAIMSLFEGELVFEWFIHKDYINSFDTQHNFFEMRLAGNKEESDWLWRFFISKNIVCVYYYLFIYLFIYFIIIIIIIIIIMSFSFQTFTQHIIKYNFKMKTFRTAK
ncbi:hypothetical protein RFI_15783, partial [Reticulomyxa filosa]